MTHVNSISKVSGVVPCQLAVTLTMSSTVQQSVPLATSPKPLFSKYSFGLVEILQIQYIL